MTVQVARIMARAGDVLELLAGCGLVLAPVEATLGAPLERIDAVLVATGACVGAWFAVAVLARGAVP